MFEQIKTIDVDRKNSLPVADLHARYRGTSTPVVFGDLTHHWPAINQWSDDYLASNAGEVQVPIYSNNPNVNSGQPYTPLLHSSLRVYLEELLHKKNDLRVSRLPLNSVPQLERDFLYPRLGFNFNANLTSISVGGDSALEPMRQSSSILHTVRCHFGDKATVLLIPKEFSGFMYRVGGSQNCVRDINFDQPQFDKYPALKYISGYVAELSHGDALYIPSGFWHCVAYQGVGISMSFEALRGSFLQYAGTMGKFLLNRAITSMSSKDARMTRLEKQIIENTNNRLLKR